MFNIPQKQCEKQNESEDDYGNLHVMLRVITVVCLPTG